MAERIFKRKIYDKILNWKRNSMGSSALLIEGARRVGKSTIAEEFARNEYASYILIDFNAASPLTKSLFDDLTDLDYIFLTLQATYHKTLERRKSVIIFDEVQQCPNARQAIKYLVADGRYDYIETGSLISTKKNIEGITIPSEEDRLQMQPMDYEEFRWALGDESTMPLLKQFWASNRPLGAAHRTMMRDFRLYMLVGGMPQAVNALLNTNNLQAVDTVKRRIVQLYADDFRKIDAAGRLSKMFLSIPGELSRNVSRYVASRLLGNIDELSQAELLAEMEDSKVVNLCYHADDPNIGLSLTKNIDRFKLFIADTGLFVTMAFWDKDFTENIIYQQLLSDKLSANLGYVYENLIAQMIVAGGNELFYYTWSKDEKHKYEVDFILSRGNKICPIEVKSSGYKAHASLDAFVQKFSARVGSSYLIYTKDFSHDGATVLVPAYLTMML